MKKVYGFLMLAISIPCFAITPNKIDSTLSKNVTMSNCPQAAATTDPNFCNSFKTVAQCHCTSSGLPQSFCRDVNTIYARMISMFGSLKKACEYQSNKPDGTSVQVCIDDWNCYRFGGRDSNGGLCSSSGNSCK